MPADGTAVRSRRDSGSRQTLLVLQFVIEFANIWAQYSPSTYASTHFGFFLICALMCKWQPFKVGNRRNFPYFSLWNPKYGRQGIQIIAVAEAAILTTICEALCPYGLSSVAVVIIVVVVAVLLTIIVV